MHVSKATIRLNTLYSTHQQRNIYKIKTAKNADGENIQTNQLLLPVLNFKNLTIDDVKKLKESDILFLKIDDLLSLNNLIHSYIIDMKISDTDYNVLIKIINYTITANNRYLSIDSSLEKILTKYNVLFSHLIFPTTIGEDGTVGIDLEKINLADEDIDEEPITGTIIDLPLLASELNPDTFLSKASNNRVVYFSENQGTSFKLFSEQSSYGYNDSDALADKRLNAIYKSSHFYAGKYKQYAQFSTHTFTMNIDESGKIKPSDMHYEQMVSTFSLIPEAEPLEANELIPLSVLTQIEKLGYLMYDVKPNNFVKIKNENGGYDYLPIDGKCIMKFGSGSIRSKNILKYLNEGFYYYGFKYIDMTK